MKCSGVVAVILLGLIAGSQAHSLSPITRVVELLQGLAGKVEAELKTEESLYEKYVCWATTVINSKTQSNVEAKQRITTLESYINDLDSNRVELTSERQDLTTEVQGLNADIEDANAQRAQEHEDFLMAKDEMEKAIAALERSIETLHEATKDYQEGSFMAIRRSGDASVAHGHSVGSQQLAVQMVHRALSTEDAELMEKLLTSDVPVWDWEKLNRDATFKMKYKARSGKIMEILQELKMTFESNLAQAEGKEKEAHETHEKLSGAKAGQLSSTEQSLSKLEVEGAARADSRTSSATELEDLRTQVSNDEGFISDTKAALDTKKQEWKTRKDLRRAEIEAISKAIAILRSDDARDLFKRSFASQGYSFLSLRSTVAKSMSSSLAQRRGSDATQALRAAAVKSGDARLRKLAGLVASKEMGHFDKVIEAIDTLIGVLQREEAKDLEVKEDCEKDRADNARAAIVASRTIDEYTDTLARLASEIDALNKNIQKNQDEIDSINEQIDAATRIRNDEHDNWVKSNADDVEAAEVVQQAIDVLTTFYQENGLALIEAAKEAPTVVAGEAPPPPPPTWEAPYGGASGEKDGIISILTLIHEDIVKDKETAKNAEDDALETYNKFKMESEAAIRALESDISSMEKTKGTKEDEVDTTSGLRLTEKGSLDSILKGMAQVAPGCVFATVNYPMRLQNRQIEMDGLEKAKSILLGALPVS